MSLEKRAFYRGFVEVLLASGIPESSTRRLVKQALSMEDIKGALPYAAAGMGGLALGGLGGYGIGKAVGGPPVPDWLQQAAPQAGMTPEEFSALSPYEQAYALGMTDVMGGGMEGAVAEDQGQQMDQDAGTSQYFYQ